MTTRINRDTISRNIFELIGDTSENTYDYFEPRREKNNTTQAKIRIPEHQRFYVWSENRKSPLIDSIMENSPLPLIVLTQHIILGNTVWFTQDGQQRLMTLQKFILGEFPWENKNNLDSEGKYIKKYYNELSNEEKRNFTTYKINCEIIYDPTEEQVSEIFERLNSGTPLTHSDKFYNRRDTSVVSFILKELILHPNLKDYLKKYTGLNINSKTRVQFSDIIGAVVSIINNSVHCIRTSFERIGSYLYTTLSNETKNLVIDVFIGYFKLIDDSLNKSSIKKPKKDYLKLTNMFGIYLYWRLHPKYYETKLSSGNLDEDLRKWEKYAENIQNKNWKTKFFSSLPVGCQRNIDVAALEGRVNYLINYDFQESVITESIDENSSENSSVFESDTDDE